MAIPHGAVQWHGPLMTGNDDILSWENHVILNVGCLDSIHNIYQI